MPRARIVYRLLLYIKTDDKTIIILMKKQSLNKNSYQSESLLQLKRQKRLRALLIVCVCLVAIPMLSAAVTAGAFSIWANTQSVDASLLPTASAVPVYYDADGNELPYYESNFVSADNISDNLRYAFVALEDKRFYEHNGFDIVRIGGAMLKNLKAGSVREGASTITQQLVKNTHLTHERTLSRKLKELAIAIQLEKQYGKDEILSMYLSVIYFGNGAYGVKQAATVYFGKDIAELSLSECATLAGLVRNPSKYAPNKRPEESKKRRDIALGAMLKQNYISQSEYEEAVTQPIVTLNGNGNQSDSSQLSAKSCEFYIAQAEKEVCAALGMTKYQLGNSGFKIYTCLDADLQMNLERQRLSEDNYAQNGINSVSVVIDNATGAVMAYSSSYPYSISRQTGSVLKPLAVYAPAFDCGLISPATPVVDEKTDFGGYSPDNFDGVYYGNTNIREAIKKSINTVSVKVMDYLGTENSTAYLNNMGIPTSESDKNYALALGATSKGVSPLGVAGGYCTIARGGEYVSPTFVRFVVDDGMKIVSNESESGSKTQRSRRALSESASALMTSALIDTVKDGTARTLSVLPFQVASKTGTAERGDGLNSDAWNASYNRDYTVVVWHGNDEGITEKGGGYPTRHALKIWRELGAKKPLDQYISLGDSVIEREIDTYSTILKKQVIAAGQNTPQEYRKTEYFAPDNLPVENGSKFDEIPNVRFDISNTNGKIDVSFASESIYSYELYRSDLTGVKLILSDVGNDGILSLSDYPIVFDSKVEYTLVCHLLYNEEICNSFSRYVYVKDYNLG